MAIRGTGSTYWGRLRRPEVKELCSSSAILIYNKWLLPSPSPVVLQYVRQDPPHCCNLLSVDPALTGLVARIRLVVGLLGSQVMKELVVGLLGSQDMKELV
jgi:hypothetical protein